MVEAAVDFATAHTAFLARDYASAAAACEQALQQEVQRPDGWTLLGMSYRALGQPERAEACYRRAIALGPDYPDAHSNLGNLLLQRGQPAAAVAAYRAALARRPQWPDVQNTLAEALRVSEQPDAALAVLKPLLAEAPQFADAYLTLGNTLNDLYRLEKAIVAYQRAIALRPDFAEAFYNLGNVLREHGNPREAVLAYRQALRLKPEMNRAHSNLLFTLQLDPEQTPASLLAEHRQWDQQHGLSRLQPAVALADADPERCLRVGLVSADFCRHPVGFFLSPLLPHIDPARLSLHAYSATARRDEMTEQLAAHLHWHEIAQLDDEALFRQVRADRIDILIDLSGHTAGNRLTLFAMKPAPVQASWAGYVGSTGLSAMDYLITDPRESPPGCEADYIERPARMPHAYVCYAPPAYAAEVGPLPALRNGYLTFGCFNNLVKIGPQVVQAWGRLLRRLPTARLELITRQLDEPGVATTYRQLFEAEGVAERVVLLGRLPHPQLLARYQGIDIALDPFPYSGGLTTLEALWMGVPVITLGGTRFASRHSISHLSAAGCTETIAADLDAYLDLACVFSTDLPRLAALRAGLRERMRGSPLLDGAGFARDWQALLRQMWHEKLGQAAAAPSLHAALAALQAERLDEAERLSAAVLAATPGADVLTLRGLIARRQGRPMAAREAYAAAMALAPDYLDAPYNLANLECELGDFKRACQLFEQVLASQPAHADAWIGLAHARLQLGQTEAALQAGRQAVQVAGEAPLAHFNLANALLAAGQVAAAEAHYRQALALPPRLRSLQRNLGLLLRDRGEWEAARAALQAEVAAFPEHGEAWANLADCLNRVGEIEAALTAMQRAIALLPALPALRANLGSLLQGQGRYQEAMAAYLDAHQHGETAPVLLANIGNLHALQRRYDEALHWYDLALAAAPDDLVCATNRLHVLQKCCRWADLHEARRVVDAVLAAAADAPAPTPFPFLALPCVIHEAEHLHLARRFARQLAQGITPLPARAPGPRPARLRLGYVSADFHNHATAHLMRGLFGRHDRSRFSVHAYSFGPDDGSEYRRRIAADCDAFVDLAAMGPAECARRIRADGIDVLIDLKGYTGDSRPAVFAYRPAPLQLAWLGYPGSMGADFIDYVLGDPIVTPPAAQADYSEKLALLPHCYQVNDDSQTIDPAPSRTEAGLPEQGLVFCCFNAHYKLDEAAWAIWMRLLQAVPGSVLWLMSGYPAAEANLRAAATAAGVDAARLVFAPKLAKAAHLGRQQLADLFLDTRWYGAHTTASDALWAGVPVLSCPGATFASRVGASLLTAVGLPELIMADWAQYEATALALAGDPARLAALRSKLASQRQQCALFDTAGFVRDLEATLDACWHNKAEQAHA